MTKTETEQYAIDVPQVAFSHLMQKIVRAEIVSLEKGIVAGTDKLEARARLLGLQYRVYVPPGAEVQPGQVIASVIGNPVQVTQGEDLLLGTIAKVSGVATAAREAVRRAGNIRVVCGAWKKMPVEMKQELREALSAGGVDTCILPRPFLYLDKNYIRIFGSLSKALDAAYFFPGRPIAIQLRSEAHLIGEEALAAARSGVQVLMVDTGRVCDLREVSETMRQEGLRQHVQLAFAGGLTLSDLDNLRNEDLDIVDIGRAILDAPLIDFRYDVVSVED